MSSIDEQKHVGVAQMQQLRKCQKVQSRSGLITLRQVPFGNQTGCDSGFGHNLAKRLDSKGFHVFATCLFPSGDGANELRKSCSDRLKILELDVRKDESVDKAVQFLKQNLGSCELWALVNNAGIGKTFCVELSPLSDFQECMDVNLFGVIRTTKAFLPFLKKSKGRIVNITSIAGTTAGPHVAPYFVSKFAVVGLTYVLMQELTEWGVTVISIEPEMFRTGLTDVNRLTADANPEKFSEELKNSYDEQYLENYRKSATILLKAASSNIGAVIDDLESAVTLLYPESIYCPRRHELFRIPLFIFVSFPLSIQAFIVRCVLFLLRYKKPKCAQ
nr:estradiol 17-beta-dehydrogenase 2 [Parasteatoda tepidariorum]